MVESNPLHVKVIDSGLRRFVEGQEDGRKSVMIELDLPSTVVSIGRRHSSQVRGADLYSIVASDNNSDKTKDKVRRLKTWLEGMGLKVRYLGSSHVFLTKVTSNQLMRIVHSDGVRSVALNRRVRPLEGS